MSEPASGESQQPANSCAGSSPRFHCAAIHWAAGLGALAALTLAMFGGVLFTSTAVVLSKFGTDLSAQFVAWRSFGFGELRHGHLALWNPHLFSGAPFFGGLQSALLYPLNALFLVLPVDGAINGGIALHVFLAGAFTFAWAAKRGLCPPACFLAGVMFMFCGAFFLRIYAGNLPNLCAMVWAPLLFLAIDGLFDAPSLRWSLLGMFAVAMQVLSGHPQYVFYTGIAAILYCVLTVYGNLETLRIEAARRHLVRSLLGLGSVLVGGVALSAAQLLPSLEESGETLRSVGVPYEFAAAFSFPPENVLTMLAPGLLGDGKTIPYWGRWYLWETSLFLGAGGLALAIMGAVSGGAKVKRFSIAMAGLLFLLALGGNTPLLHLLYDTVPGFDRFRGNSKFIFLVSLFLAMLAAVGFDELWKGRRPHRLLAGGFATASALLFSLSAWMRWGGSVADVAWRRLTGFIRDTGESYVTPATFDNVEFLRQTLRQATGSLMAGGAVLLLVALLLLAVRWRREAAWALLGLTVIELFVFAHGTLASFDLERSENPVAAPWVKAHPGDYRMLDVDNPNAALMLGAADIWGNDPGILRRYAEFIAFTQGMNPDQATQYVQWRRDSPLLDMLRLRVMFTREGDHTRVIERANYLPHLLLVPKYRVLSGRNEILAAMNNSAFNPRDEVILESAPVPAPIPVEDTQTVRITAESTDSLTVEADLVAPAILLITDTYSRNWHAHSVVPGEKVEYPVMPANYCLRAIPLDVGHHLIRMEYVPTGFTTGMWISGISGLLFLGTVLLVQRRDKRKKGTLQSSRE